MNLWSLMPLTPYSAVRFLASPHACRGRETQELTVSSSLSLFRRRIQFSAVLITAHRGRAVLKEEGRNQRLKWRKADKFWVPKADLMLSAESDVAVFLVWKMNEIWAPLLWKQGFPPRISSQTWTKVVVAGISRVWVCRLARVYISFKER